MLGVSRMSYKELVQLANQEFKNKYNTYGNSWLAFRCEGMTDQIMMKIIRLRELETIESLVDENPIETLRAIYNYCMIRQIMCYDPIDCPLDIYENLVNETFELMVKKNNDYGSVWQMFRVGTLYDLMLAKIYRVRSMEDKKLKINLEEFKDIANYSIFAIILLDILKSK